ncbi:MAG: PEP-CTERM/exosortase system-associated acyltransferase [Pseudomonadota bacterium]
MIEAATPSDSGLLEKQISSQKSIAKQDLLTPFFYFQRAIAGIRDSAMVREIFQLRYEIYCIERGFLPAENFSNGLETDAYDDCSTHFAGYNMENVIVGSVRLVQPPLSQVFPFEEHCPVFDTFTFPPREQTGEISRLVVRKSYRRRRGDSPHGVSQEFMQSPNGAVVPQAAKNNGKRRKGDSPRLLLGMYREMYRHSKATGIRYWYAAMERSLASSLRKMGFTFVPIGPTTDYYGPVTPFIVDLEELNETLRRENRLLAAWFNDEPIPLWLRVQTWLMLHVGKR